MSNQNIIPATLAPVLDYVLKSYNSYNKSSSTKRPLVVGVSGPQGLGKTTLATALQEKLSSSEHGSLKVAQFSLDDVYKTHDEQKELANQHKDNPLVQTRGQPGTHDTALCVEVLNALCGKLGQEVMVPRYDKAAFGGEGDREFQGTFPAETSGTDESKDRSLDVVIFEGWCVGFQSYNNPDGLQCQAELAKQFDGNTTGGTSAVFGQLMKHPEYLGFVDTRLKSYQEIWDFFDVFVHLDAQDINWVYDWRLQQEHAMIKEKGIGKTDQQVRQFVDGYMSAYYVYVPKLRRYMCNEEKNAVPATCDFGDLVTSLKVPNKLLGKRIQGHMRIIVNHDRQISQIIAMGYNSL